MPEAADFLKNSRLGNGTEPTNSEKWWASVAIGIIFAIISSGFVYGLTNSASGAIGGPVLYNKGGATWSGLILHTIVFTLIIRLLLK